MLSKPYTADRHNSLLHSLSRRTPAEFRDALLQKIAATDAQQQAAAKVETGLQTGGETGLDDSATARLIGFYIDRARRDSASDNAADRQQAESALDRIRAGLTEEPVARPPVAAAAPVPDRGDPDLARGIALVYRTFLSRPAAKAEIDIWHGHLADGMSFLKFLLLIAESDEAQAVRDRQQVLTEMSDGAFIQNAHRIILNRGALPQEIDQLRREMVAGRQSRDQLIKDLFARAAAADAAGPEAMVHDGLSCWIMGTSHTLTLAEWQEKARDTEALAKARAAQKPATPFTITGGGPRRVSILTSLYCGGEFIEMFMDNMASQSCFDDHCELIIVDAQSPENEAATIERYMRSHDNIVYRRMDSRVGIYEAWNIAAEMAGGLYLTNANLDDLRREDSFEMQAGALDAMPFVDVVYQDFYYSFDPKMSWEEVAAFGYKSDLPVITPLNILSFNSPHNAPMWRRSLHDELGFFDARLKSAGDYEFWMRCLTAGKTFYKINEPHVVYYQNPNGLSTRADTRGLVESWELLHKYSPLLTPEELSCDFDAFLPRLHSDAVTAGAAPIDQDRFRAAQQALRDLARRFKQEAVQ